MRQKGSHVRLRKNVPNVHLITVPLHDPLKTGTLHGILTEIAESGATTIEVILASCETELMAWPAKAIDVVACVAKFRSILPEAKERRVRD